MVWEHLGQNRLTLHATAFTYSLITTSRISYLADLLAMISWNYNNSNINVSGGHQFGEAGHAEVAKSYKK